MRNKMKNKMKEDKVLFCIKYSYLPEDVKQELTDYVKSHNDAAIRAAFRLGQMDMKESAVTAIRDTAPVESVGCCLCAMQTAAFIESLEVI